MCVAGGIDERRVFSSIDKQGRETDGRAWGGVSICCILLAVALNSV